MEELEKRLGGKTQWSRRQKYLGPWKLSGEWSVNSFNTHFLKNHFSLFIWMIENILWPFPTRWKSPNFRFWGYVTVENRALGGGGVDMVAGELTVFMSLLPLWLHLLGGLPCSLQLFWAANWVCQIFSFWFANSDPVSFIPLEQELIKARLKC